MINKIALVGGTHGNETSGIQLIHNWQSEGFSDALSSRYSSLDVSLTIANPDALSANVRFVEEDLNRQFTLEALSLSLIHI